MRSRTAIISKNILAIVCGCLVAAVSCIVLLVLCVAIGLFGWSDGGDPAFLRRLEMTTEISLYASLSISAFAGGYLSSYLSRSRNVHFITASILVLFALVLANFDLTDAFIYPTILVGCILGGMANQRRAL